MFSDLTDVALAALIEKLRNAVIELVAGNKVAEIRYGEMGRKFHPASAADARGLLDDAIAERDRRAGCSRNGAIFPVGV